MVCIHVYDSAPRFAHEFLFYLETYNTIVFIACLSSICSEMLDRNMLICSFHINLSIVGWILMKSNIYEFRKSILLIHCVTIVHMDFLIS